VRVAYAGEWSGALSVTGGGESTSRSISGAGTETVEVTGTVDIVSVNAQKRDRGAGGLTVQVRHDGAVVAESSTTSEYGVAQASESFY